MRNAFISKLTENFICAAGISSRIVKEKFLDAKYNSANVKKFWEGLKNETEHERGNRSELPSNVD